MYKLGKSRLFSKGRFSDFLDKRESRIVDIINSETEDYILNVNENEYIDHIVGKLQYEKPAINFDDVCADNYEDDVPLEYFPLYNHHFDNYGPKSYKRNIIQFFVPCSGDLEALDYSPSSIIFSGGAGANADIKQQAIVFEFIDFNEGAESINRKYNSEKGYIIRKLEYLFTEIEDFNLSLKGKVLSVFRTRKDGILKKNDLMASLGVPLKKSKNVPSTYSIPKPQIREKITIKPVVNEQGFKPEPTLNEKQYQEILKTINDVGKNFERLPSVYKDKGEEALRDHILMTLDPIFEMGSATGETFNKTGKTDISLRYDSSVVFVAECKFWHGEKGYISTIDQLLSYLTWRDTKAAIILFVKQKEFSAILDKVNIHTKTHPNYLSFTNKTDENWFNFRFHINGDRSREVKLAVLLYHIPNPK